MRHITRKEIAESRAQQRERDEIDAKYEAEHKAEQRDPHDPIPTRPWPSAELRRRVLRELAIANTFTTEKVGVSFVRDLAHVSMYYGPSIVCTRDEWSEMQSDVWQAHKRGEIVSRDDFERKITEEEAAELLERTAGHASRLEASIVAEQIGKVHVDGGYRGSDDVTKPWIVVADEGEVYRVTNIASGGVDVRIIGRFIKGWLFTNWCTSNDEGELIPAFDDAKAIAEHETRVAELEAEARKAS